MIEETGSISLLPSALSECFSLEAVVASTAFSECYKAGDSKQRGSMLLWVSLSSTQKNSVEAQDFFKRLQKVKAGELSNVPFLQGGLDSNGFGFIALTQMFGEPLTLGRLDPKEAERRFTYCARAVERVHQADVWLGDVCPGSFWVGRAGEILLTELLGVPTLRGAGAVPFQGKDAARKEAACYVAPEIIAQQKFGMAADVYSLGVLLYTFFSGRAPTLDLITDEWDPEVSRDSAPRWVVPLIKRCTARDPAARFRNASAVLQGILAAKQEMIKNSTSLITLTSGTGSMPSTEVVRPKRGPQKSEAESLTSESESTSRIAPLFNKRLIAPAIGSAVVLSAVVSGLLFRSLRGTSETIESLEHVLARRLENVKNGETRSTLTKLGEAKTAQERLIRLEELALSDDPQAFQALVDAASRESLHEEQREAEGAIATYLTRKGYAKTGAAVAKWFAGSEGTKPAGYEQLLRALSPALRGGDLSTAFFNAYSVAPGPTLELLALLAADIFPDDRFHEVAREVLGAALNLEGVTQRSTMALLFAHPELSQLLVSDLSKFESGIPDNDVLWLLELLGSRNDPALRAIANLALARTVTDPVSKAFLSPIANKSGIPPQVVVGLVRGAADKLSINDIKNFGDWDDLATEQALWASCLRSKDSVLKLQAFDTVTARSIRNQTAQQLITWLKENRWKDRAQFIDLAAVLSFLDVLSPEEFKVYIEQPLSVLTDKEKTVNRSLIKVLLKSSSPTLATTLIEKFGTSLGLGETIPLLNHPSPNIRILALNNLKEYNDLGTLRIVIDHYDKEKDPTVREKYRTSFWSIQEREQRREAAQNLEQ